MLRKRTPIHATVLALCSGVIVCVSILQQIQTQYTNRMFSPQTVQPAPTALVLGASVKLDGTPSDALRDRVTTAVELYRQQKVKNLLMTGDNGAFHVNEVATMKRLAVEAGVPEQDVLVDEHGYRTYESCKRAVEVFGVTDGIVVTQRFHLSRALYLCSHLGMTKTQGVPADLETYERIFFFTARDFAASLKAWWDINILPPEPPVDY